MAQITFRPRFARRIPDPVFEISHHMVRHVLFCSARSVPLGLPLDPNARIPNISRRVYREVERSLLNEEVEPGTFHLKHKGITIVARSVERKSEDEYVVTMDAGDGILDGGHTYKLLENHLKIGDLPDEQYVKFEILTNVPAEWIAEIAGGLNTSVQVQPMSLDTLAGKFDWVKDILKGEPYYSDIAWRENDPGEYDARDLVSIMTCFNIGLFPNDKDEHPVMAYSRKSTALQNYEKKPETYERLRPILKDILYLHDIIRRDARDYHNDQGGRAGKLAFVEKRKRGEYEFPFAKGETSAFPVMTGTQFRFRPIPPSGKETSEFRLMTAALYPILAAFRWMVEDEPDTGDFRWRGGFDGVLKLWESTAAELMKLTVQASTELGRNPNALGKSRNLWGNLHKTVAMRNLMAQAAAS